MLENRRGYETKLDAQPARWKADIGGLKAKAKRNQADAKANNDKGIDTLEQKHHEAWENVKAGTEKAGLEIKAQFHSSTNEP